MKAIKLLLMGLVFLSCSKDNNVTPASTNKLLLKKYFKNGHLRTEYKYNENDRLESSIFYSPLDGETILSFHYYEYNGDTVFSFFHNQNNELVSKGKLVFNEQSGKEEKFNTDNQLTEYLVLENNIDPCGYSKIDFYDADDSLKITYNYEYIDSNCSENENHVLPGNHLIGIRTSVKDGGKNAFESTYLSERYKYNSGNSLQSILLISGSIFDPESYNSTFEYNSDNYPVSENRIYMDGIDYEYEYY